MAKSHSKVQYVKLPNPPKTARLPEVGLGKAAKIAIAKGPKGSVIPAVHIQPQRQDLHIWGWWLAAFPVSTFDEFLVYWGLRQLGLKMVGDPRKEQAGNDFIFQKNALASGGFLLPGVYNATSIDFLVISQYPFVAIFEDGLYYHQETIELDVSKRLQLKQYTNYTVITIDDVHIEQDAVFYVREALAGRGHSHLAGRGL